MIVIADTTPICYLILIKQIDVLPELFQTVQVPPQVLGELRETYNNHPEIVAWANSPPAWLHVTVPQELLTGITLDLGEVAAIMEEINKTSVLKNSRTIPTGLRTLITS